MKRISLARAAIVSALIAGSAASAQFPSLPDGAAGLLGNILPNLSSASTGNAAGILSYCLKNKYLDGQNATSVLGQLTGIKGVKSSKDYAQGSAGLLQTGQGPNVSLGDLKGGLKTRLCDMVLKHGKSLIGL